MRFTKRSKLTKDWDFSFSYDYKRLYVKMDNWVPVLCNIENSSRSGSEFQVRVTAVVVTEDRVSFPPFHLVRLEGAERASYQQDSQGRHSVIFPVRSSDAKIEKIVKIKFMDLKMEVKVVFSLEDGNGEVVGRRVFSVGKKRTI